MATPTKAGKPQGATGPLSANGDQTDGARQVTIALHANSDRASEQDHLGFQPYVDAVAEFLKNKDTEPPLVLSIEAEWGSGKTSFMLQLRNALEGKVAGASVPLADRLRRYFRRELTTIWFNPWHYEQEEALWAAFALSFIDQLTRQQAFYRRWWGHIRRFIAGYRWREGWLALLRKTLAWGLVLYLTIFLGVVAYQAGPQWVTVAVRLYDWLTQTDLKWLDPLRWGIGVGGLTAYGTLLFALFSHLRSVLEDPLKVDLRRFSDSPNYQDRLPFLDRFHADFQSVMDAYAGNQKIVVFIDDLDRCEVPRAADLMSALNLMMADDRRLIFVLGIDSEKVAAGLAVKYEKLLPYVLASRTGSEAPVPGSQALGGLDFGYEFLRKFIQVQFVLPRPDQSSLDEYLAGLSESKPQRASAFRSAFARARQMLAGPGSEAGAGATGSAPRGPRPARPSPDARETSTVISPTLGRAETISPQLAEGAQPLPEVLQAISPLCGDNPRWLRLIADELAQGVVLAEQAGLFSPARAPRPLPALTLPQAAKLVALRVRWPKVYRDVVDDLGLLPALQEVALGGAPSVAAGAAVDKWRSAADLMAFLKAGSQDEAGNPDAARSAAWRLSGERLAEFIGLMEAPRSEPGSQQDVLISPGRQDSAAFCALAKTLAPAFEGNPRRLKLFTNVLRLHTYIAWATHRFDIDYTPGAYPPPTLEQLGKLIAISLSWRSLYRDIVETPGLLTALQQAAVGQTPKAAEHFERWANRPDLTALLRVGCFDETTGQIEPAHGYDWLLADLNLERLIQIAPLVQRAAPEAVQPAEVAGAVAFQAAEPLSGSTTWRVLMVIYDPVVDQPAGKRLIEGQGWHDPDRLAADVLADVQESSGGFVQLKIAGKMVLDDWPVGTDGFRYDGASYLAAVREGRFHSPATADYNSVIGSLRLLERIAHKEFDEVWLFGGPGFGFYESRMAGPGAFWCNAPACPSTDPSRRRFVLMGFSYERGVGEMLENIGHRAESILSYVYRKFPAEQNLFGQFTQYDSVAPGQANCGTLHWAPNSQRDYDLANPRRVESNCDEWLEFPNLTGKTRPVNCEEWGGGDMRAHHKWWLRHLPRAPGATNKILNNWWEYVVDPNKAA